MAEDVIVSAFASPATSGGKVNGIQINGASVTPDELKRLDLFENRPRWIDAGGVDRWTQYCQDMASRGGGSILRGMGVPGGGRICLVAFSQGNSFLWNVMKSRQDIAQVDTIIALDGPTIPQNGQAGRAGRVTSDFQRTWAAFARKAAGVDRMLEGSSSPYQGPLFVSWATNIPPRDARTASSTVEAQDYLFELINADYQQAVSRIPRPVIEDQGRRQREAIARAERVLASMQPAVVRCGNPETTRTFQGWRPQPLGYLGNFWAYYMRGLSGPDHCMVAYAGLRTSIEAHLAPRWNSRNVAVSGLAGLGTVERTEAPGAATFRDPGPGTPGGGFSSTQVLPAGAPAWLKVAGAGAAAVAGFLAARKVLG